MSISRLLLPTGCRLHSEFHCDLLSHATSSTFLRPRRVETDGDHEDYSIKYISDAKIDN